MKRCPQCNRVETDDTLVFCRADGTALIGDSGPVSADAGTMKFGSAPVSSEIETSVLPHTSTSPEIDRATGPTTVLHAQPSPSTTSELTKPKRRGFVLALLGLVVVGVAIAGYFYCSRNHKTAIQSIAVMPFVNESGNADLEYLSDGMTETLIRSLSQLANLQVKPRSSVFRYKGKETDAKIIGKELNVQAILNGRVTQRGDQLTLNLELIDVQKDVVLWSEQYNRKQTDLVSLQSEIAKDVQWYALLLGNLGRIDEATLMMERAKELDPLSSVISSNISAIYQRRNDHQASIENSLKLIELDPNFPPAYQHLGLSYLKQGRTTDGIANLERAVEMSKRDRNFLSVLGYGYAVTGKRTEAIAILKELEEKYPRKESREKNIATVYAGLGEKDKAFEWLEKGFPDKGDLSLINWEIPFESLGDDPRYKDLVKRMGLPE